MIAYDNDVLSTKKYLPVFLMTSFRLVMANNTSQ